MVPKWVQTRAAVLIPICLPLPFTVLRRDTIRNVPFAIIRSGKFPASDAVGVGQDEDPAPAMARACFSRREQSRFCCIAQLAKASCDVGKSQIDMAFDIFAKEPFGPDFVGDSGDFGPKVTGIVGSPPLSGMAEGLAGIAGSDDMNATAPRSAVEGSQIVPNRGLAQGRIFHPRHEGGRRMGFPLDVSHSPVSGFGDVQAKVEAGITGTERDASQFAFMNAGGT
jgi:hypothetical protein